MAKGISSGCKDSRRASGSFRHSQMNRASSKVAGRRVSIAPRYGLAEIRASLYPRAREEAPEPVAKVTRAVLAASARAARFALGGMNSVLITGGTGSLGRALIRHYLTTPVARIAILSRDEWKQAMLAKELTDDRIRWFLGDVRDPERLEMAFHGIDTVIHAAALKRIDRVAYDPSEVIKPT